jgi:transcriptional regulator with XRE-family HTH domain
MDRLAAWIAENGTQRQLARDVQCSAPTICQILHGRKKPSPHLASRISRVTGIPATELRPDLAALMAPAEPIPVSDQEQPAPAAPTVEDV